MKTDEKFMAKALNLAGLGLGKVSPNPLVGAVIVRGNNIVGEGHHQKAGTPHAEIHALREAKERASGAAMYVTLEPCCHQGKTPPCTDAIIKAGISRVVVGMTDPNPLVAGKGVETLQRAGIKVLVGVLEDEVRLQNEVFIKYITTKRPFVTLKSAISLDGKIATRTGDSKWITGEDARRVVHQMRAANDAIMVGIGTVLADDPLLTVRLDGEHEQPLRVIVDSHLRIPEDSRLVRSAVDVPTLIVTIKGGYSAEKRKVLEGRCLEFLEFPEVEGRIDLRDLMMELGKREITSLILEGGAHLNGSALEAGIIDKFVIFQAPLIIGGQDAPGIFGGKGFELLSDSLRFGEFSVRKLGKDLMFTAYV